MHCGTVTVSSLVQITKKGNLTNLTLYPVKGNLTLYPVYKSIGGGPSIFVVFIVTYTGLQKFIRINNSGHINLLHMKCKLPHGWLYECAVQAVREIEYNMPWSSRMNQKPVVTGYLYTPNINQHNLKPATCEPNNIKVYTTCLLDLLIDLWQVPGFNTNIYIYLSEIKLMKPVTCCCQLPTHSAWSHHITCISS